MEKAWARTHAGATMVESNGAASSNASICTVVVDPASLATVVILAHSGVEATCGRHRDRPAPVARTWFI